MNVALSVGRVWGVTRDETALSFPCDRLLPGAADVWFRAIDVSAPAWLLFRWLCQLRVAPYSYDWVDNFGRQSPRRLTSGLERLEVGQRFMSFFRLAEFEPGRQITLLAESGALLGGIALSYVVGPAGASRCRLVVKIVVRYPRGPLGWVTRLWLPWGDLVMMRKQLLTLKELAEEQARPEG